MDTMSVPVAPDASYALGTRLWLGMQRKHHALAPAQ